jgi:hypothetical protein
MSEDSQDALRQDHQGESLVCLKGMAVVGNGLLAPTPNESERF